MHMALFYTGQMSYKHVHPLMLSKVVKNIFAMVIPGVTRGGSLMWRRDLKPCLKVVSSEVRSETGRMIQKILHAKDV